jgi:2-methylcitrate dehydratase PrpD
MNQLHELARRFADWKPADDDLVAARTLDACGAFLAGAATAEGRAIREHAAGWDPGPAAAVARLVATIRLTELDDIHMPSCTTPGAVVVASAVTIGAELDVEAERFRRAVEVGYEAMTRLGAAIDGAHVVYRGVWPTYFAAPFAAAAVVASLLELDARRTAHALGLALTRATGLTSGIVGTRPGRWLTVGDAARAGCAAAFAARDGFVADVDLERVGVDTAALLAERTPAAREVSVKPFPVAKQCLAAAEAALALGGRAAASPLRVHVPEPYAEMVAAAPLAESRLSRIASVRWNVSLALARPSELHDVERTAAVDDAKLAAIARRVEVVADPELSRLYPARWPARVDAEGASETVVDAAGDPPADNGFATVDAKWRDRPEDVRDLRAAALAGDVGHLAALLRGDDTIANHGSGSRA